MQDDKAIEFHTQSLEMWKFIYKDEPHPPVADSFNSLGKVYESEGQYDQTKEHFNKSLIYKLFYE